MALVQVEAYLDRKKKYFSTKVYLKPEQWDNKKLIVKNHPNADALNRLIYEFMAMIEKKELEQHKGNLSQVAVSLGISRAALYRRLEKYNIQVPCA